MSEVRLDRDGAVAVVTLAAPETRNALTPELARELIDVLEAVNADATVGATVLRGADGTFCAGADREVIARSASDPLADDVYSGIGIVYECFARLESLATPSIAAVRGYAVGAGLNLALAADVRIVSRTATLRSGFLRIGLHPGGGHFTLAGRVAGWSTTAAMALFSCDVDGDRAVSLGLAWQAVDDEGVEAAAIERAHVAARDPALARLATRHLRLEASAPLSVAAATELERAAQLWSFRRLRRE